MLTISPDPGTPAGPYTVGDQPPGITATVLDADGDPVPLDGVWQVLGQLLSPEGGNQPVAVGWSTDLDSVDWTWPAGAFPDPGLYQVSLVLSTATGELAPDLLPVIVEAVGGWLTLAMARQLWPDATAIPDLPLWFILESAKAASVAYAPALPVGAPIPPNWVQAQLSQARAVWNLMQTAPQSDLIGYDQSAIRVYPLDYNVRQLLRPKSGKPVMF